MRHFTIDETESYQAIDRFKHSKAIVGISSVHVMQAEGASLQLWENSQKQANHDSPLRCDFPKAAPMPAPAKCVVSYKDVVKITTDPIQRVPCCCCGKSG